jgi:hypothetical protein
MPFVVHSNSRKETRDKGFFKEASLRKSWTGVLICIERIGQFTILRENLVETG